MGAEGAAAKHYWTMVCRALDGRVAFTGRTGQGATDLLNNMLNYAYALLRSRVHLAILRAGLTPEIGFLHAAYKGRPALVFDLMEEFRPYAVDRTVLTLLRCGQHAELNDQDRLTKATRRQLVTAVQERLATPVTFRSRRCPLQAVIQRQARALAKHLQCETPYRPWIGRW
jgi:CRISPR-associated protein Cas1